MVLGQTISTANFVDFFFFFKFEDGVLQLSVTSVVDCYLLLLARERKVQLPWPVLGPRPLDPGNSALNQSLLREGGKA